MSNMSALRALRPLRLLLFAAGLALGCIVLGASWASADDSPHAGAALGRPSVPLSTLSTQLLRPPTVAQSTAVVRKLASPKTKTMPRAVAGKPMTLVHKPIALLAKPIALIHKRSILVVKPITLVHKAIARVDMVASMLPPVTSVVALVAAQAPGVHGLVSRAVNSVVSATLAAPKTVGIIGLSPEAGGLTPPPQSVSPVAGSALATDQSESRPTLTPAPDVLAPTSVAVLTLVGPAASMGASDLVLPASPNAPVLPTNAPLSTTSGAGANGSGSGGHGSTVADIPIGPSTSAGRRLGMLPDSSWVMPDSLTNDPGSSPD